MTVIERWSDNEALVAKAAEALFREGACECGDCAVRDMLPMAAAVLDVAQDHAGGAVEALRQVESELARLFVTYGDDTPGWEIQRVQQKALAALGGR